MKSLALRSGALAFLLASGALLATGPGRTPDVIGEEIALDAPRASAAFPGRAGLSVDSGTAAASDEEAELVWSTELFFAGADYVAPHFSRFDLPPGAHVVVRSPDGSRSWTYRGTGKPLASPDDGFWAIHVYGESALVELYAASPVEEGSVVVDRFARGFSAGELSGGKSVVHPLALCGTDDSLWAKCYQTSEATAYTRSKAVARLMINGTGACTGWLVGNQGHVMTNEHCITSASDATNTTFEFMAEGATCSTACNSWGACPGTVVASTSTFVKNSATYDYALVKLPTNPTGTYGYLQLRSSGASLGERIYIPQHPAAWGKKIAMKSGTANATVTGLSEPACAGGASDVGYSADTQGGSSGSPVLGYSDNLVVALHHCGTCPNRAVPIQSVIADLGASLPPGSTGGGGTTYSVSGNAGTTGATVTAGGRSATSDASSNYSITGLAAGTFTVTPSKSGCTFTPTSRSVTITSANLTGVSFTASCGSTDTPLTSGVTLTGQSVAKGAWKYYYIAVPSGATSLTLATTSASADVDIYTQSGAKPTASSYVCRPYSSSGNETCTATSPAAGTWWLGVYGYAAGSFSVTGTVVTGGGGATTLFSDGFESGGWSTAQVSGTAGAWTFPSTGAHPTASPHGGTKLASFNSYTSASGSQTRLYRSTGFAVGSSYASVTLKFWTYHDTGYSTYADKVQAQVSTNGTTWTNVGTAVARYNGTTGWAQVSVDLTAYKGQTVRLAFVGQSAYGNDEYLDDVTVTAQ